MKLTSITIQHTRQVRQYEPLVVSISADLDSNEDIMEASKELQRLVLMVAYKDKPVERDMLIKALVDDAQSAPKVATEPIKKDLPF